MVPSSKVMKRISIAAMSFHFMLAHLKEEGGGYCHNYGNANQQQYLLL
jgi:hypothetical protein